MAPQLLTPLDSSNGYPALDPTLLAISIPQMEPSLTSKTSSTSEVTPSSNIASEPSTTVLSTRPNNGAPGRCNDEVSATKPAGNKSTWAARNPGWPVMKPRQSLSAVEKEHHSAHAASRQISAAQQKDRDVLLNEAIWSLADEFEAKVQVLATTHNVTHEKVKKLLGVHKYYRNPRGTQLANAIIHDKAHEVNEGRARGEKLSLQQIRDLAKVDPKYQDMTQDEKDELLRALTEYRCREGVLPTRRFILFHCFYFCFCFYSLLYPLLLSIWTLFGLCKPYFVPTVLCPCLVTIDCHPQTK